MTRHLLCLLLLAGCDSSMEVDAGSTPGADAGPIASDAGGGVDAGGSDAGGADAGGMDAGTADAGPSDAGAPDAGDVDAGPISAAVVCNALCTTLMTCVDAPPGEFEECEVDCTEDLLDCTDPQLHTLRMCNEAPDRCELDPVTMAPKLFDCLMSVPCVMG